MTEDILGLEDLASQIDARGPQEAYQHIHLAFNPFPVAGTRAGDIQIPDLSSGQDAAVSIPLFPPLDPGQLQTIRGFLSSTLRIQQFAGLMVVGDYGFGKSHLLRFIEHHVNSFQGEIRGGKIRAFYVKNPSTKPQDLLFALTKSIGEDEFWKITWSIILQEVRQFCLEQDFDQLAEALFAEVPLLIPPTDRLKQSLDEEALSNAQLFLQRCKQLGITEKALRAFSVGLLRRHLDNLDVINQMVAIAFGEEYSSFESWMSLASPEARRPVKIPKLDHFDAILKILQLYGVSFVYILIDEFEDIAGVRVSARQRAEYAATLRMFIDAQLENFAMVLGITAEGLDIVSETHPPFVDRFTHRIDLRPLTVDQARSMTVRYLNLARGQAPFSEWRDQPTPFTEDALNEITTRTRGNPRAVLSISHRAIERCRSENIAEATAEIIETC